MAKAKKKSASKSSKKKHPLLREIPALHSMVVVLYVLLGILFLAIFLTRFA